MNGEKKRFDPDDKLEAFFQFVTDLDHVGTEPEPPQEVTHRDYEILYEFGVLEDPEKDYGILFEYGILGDNGVLDEFIIEFDEAGELRQSAESPAAERTAKGAKPKPKAPAAGAGERPRPRPAELEAKARPQAQRTAKQPSVKPEPRPEAPELRPEASDPRPLTKPRERPDAQTEAEARAKGQGRWRGRSAVQPGPKAKPRARPKPQARRESQAPEDRAPAKPPVRQRAKQDEPQAQANPKTARGTARRQAEPVKPAARPGARARPAARPTPRLETDAELGERDWAAFAALFGAVASDLSSQADLAEPRTRRAREHPRAGAPRAPGKPAPAAPRPIQQPAPAPEPEQAPRPETGGKSPLILRFTRSERLLHWSIAVPFLVCLLSAFVLFFVYTGEHGPLRPLFSWIHRISAIFLIVLPPFVLITHWRDYKVHLENIKEAFVWTMRDIKWLMLMPLSTFNKKIELPPQDKFNAAEKINFMNVFGTYPLYVITGILIWLPGVAFWPWAVHVAMAAMAVPLLIGHIFMATCNPETKVGLSGMITGFVDRNWAKHHYADWYRRKFEEPQKDAEAPEAEQQPRLAVVGPKPIRMKTQRRRAP